MELLLSNIRRNSKTYLFYYLAIMLNVMMVYVFYSITDSKELVNLINQKTQILIVFKIAAIAVGIFASFFIFYATSYFVKNRSNEIALYSLFGMKKSRIAYLLVLENMTINVIASLFLVWCLGSY